MNRDAFNSWAKPLLDALSGMEEAARSVPGDFSMLNDLAKRVADLPLPDWEPLADEMTEGMARAAAGEIGQWEGRFNRSRQRRAAFAVDRDFAPIEEAARKISARTPVVSKLRSEEWLRLPLAFRERGQFSSGVESIRVMANIQSKLEARVGHYRELLANNKEAFVSRDSFIRDIQQIARDEGLDTGKGNVLTNIAAPRRIGLIYDMQTAQAAGYARWKLDNDRDALAILPAWRLGSSSAKNPRAESEWLARWREAGAAVNWEGASQTSMVALKTSPIWRRLSRFGTPWPPFDFGSTRELEDVWRDEAEQLGLISPEDEIAPTMEKDFNEELEASAADWRPDQVSTLKMAFGDQVQERGGRVAWQGSLIRDLLDRSINDRTWNGKAVSLGTATPVAINRAGSIIDLSGMELKVDPSHIRKTWRDHGPRDAYEPGSGEKRAGHLPLSKLDYDALPHLWRDPDKVRRGDQPGDVIFEKQLQGQLVGVTWSVSEGKTLLLKSLYKWK